MFVMNTFSVVLAGSRLHEALVPQRISAMVFVNPPVHVAAPAFVAAPQSLSISRIVAFDATNTDSLNVKLRKSPASRLFGKPALDKRLADVDVGRVASAVAGILTGT